MCKGLGKRQKAILAALADGATVPVRTLAGESPTPAEYGATLRAAHRLADAGKVRLVWGNGLSVRSARGRIPS